MSTGLWIPKPAFELIALVGKGYDVAIDGHAIKGRFGSKRTVSWEFADNAVLEDFVNWPRDPKAIGSFTRKYGPLISQPYHDTRNNRPAFRPNFGASWTFPIEQWQAFQSELRQEWGKPVGSFQFHVHPEPGESVPSEAFILDKNSDRVKFRVCNLSRYLKLSLYLLPAERLKICRQRDNDCPHPYFVAKHLKQGYCSTECADEAQREWKRNWWHKRQAATANATKKKPRKTTKTPRKQ